VFLYNKENVRISFQVTDQCADGEREEVYFFVLRVKFGVTYANGRNVWPHRPNISSICSKIQNIKKRPVAVLGETRPVYPDKGCVGEVLGSEYLLPRLSQDGSMELMDQQVP